MPQTRNLIDEFEQTHIFPGQVPEYDLTPAGCAFLIPGRHRPPEEFLSEQPLIVPFYEVKCEAKGCSQEDVERMIEEFWSEIEGDMWRLMKAVAKRNVVPTVPTMEDAVDWVTKTTLVNYLNSGTPTILCYKAESKLILAVPSLSHDTTAALVMPSRILPTVYAFPPSPPFATMELGLACLDPLYVVGAMYTEEA